MSLRTRALPWLFLGAILLSSSPAHADPKDDARRHFVAGLEAAREGRYQRALDEFLAAQDAYPHPNTLYNIARAHTDLGDLERAVDYYKLYREAAPERADEVDPVIAVIEARLRRAQEPPAEAVVASAPGPTSAPAAEVARLREIADELAALSESIARRGPDPVQETTAPEVPPPVAETPPAPELPEGEFISEAYERVVVTASRYGQDPLDSPSTVAILTDEDIRMSGATNVPDLLRRVVGVEVMSLSAAQPDISIRGFNRELSNKVLVLIDGRSVYVDILGTVFWGTLPISIEEIERIEIIRGPGSAIYGANAVTGVINIITRTPGTGGNLVHFEGGQPDYAQGTVLVSGRSQQTSYRMSAGMHQTGRWSAEVPYVEDGPMDFMLGDTPLSLRSVRANGRLDRTFLGKGVASLSGGYAEGHTEFYVIGALGDYAMPFKSAYGRADLAFGPVHLRTFYNSLIASAGSWAEYEGGRSLDTEVDSDTFDVEGEYFGRFTTGPIHHRVNAGVGYRYKAIQWTYLEGHGDLIDEHHYSAFAQEEAGMGRVSLLGSLRIDRHPLVDLARTTSPRGAAIVRVADRTSARLTGGTSFRAPTQMESYLDFDQPSGVDGVVVRTLGDQDLIPERIETAEVGLHDESTPWHRADVAAYVNRVRHLIFLTDVEPEVSFYDPEANAFHAGSTSFSNLDPVYTGYGLEIDGQVFPADGVDLYVNVALERINEADSTLDDQDTSSQDTSSQDQSTSAVKVNLGAMYRSPWRFDLAAHLNHASAQTWRLRDFDAEGKLVPREEQIPARDIIVARVGVRPLADDSLEVAATAWNVAALLGGEPFREHPKGQLVGARLFGSVTYHF